MEPSLPNVPPSVTPSTYSPVTVTQTDTVGAIFLGILAFCLLVVLARAEARNRALLAARS